MLRKFAITGPESTGKSTLSKQLAEYYNCVLVEEYAREYIDKLKHPYTQEDILQIAKTQKNIELQKSNKKAKLLITDTELIVTKIWSEVKYQSCHPWIIENIAKQDYDLYLLCGIDLPWEADPQREHPHLRKYLFNLYKQELESRNLNFKIISGKKEDRFKKARQFIEAYL